MSALFASPPSIPAPVVQPDPVAEQLANQQATAATNAAQQQAQQDAAARGRASLTNPATGALGVPDDHLGAADSTLF